MEARAYALCALVAACIIAVATAATAQQRAASERGVQPSSERTAALVEEASARAAEEEAAVIALRAIKNKKSLKQAKKSLKKLKKQAGKAATSPKKAGRFAASVALSEAIVLKARKKAKLNGKKKVPKKPAADLKNIVGAARAQKLTAKAVIGSKFQDKLVHQMIKKAPARVRDKLIQADVKARLATAAGIKVITQKFPQGPLMQRISEQYATKLSSMRQAADLLKRKDVPASQRKKVQEAYNKLKGDIDKNRQHYEGASRIADLYKTSLGNFMKGVNKIREKAMPAFAKAAGVATKGKGNKASFLQLKELAGEEDDDDDDDDDGSGGEGAQKKNDTPNKLMYDQSSEIGKLLDKVNGDNVDKVTSAIDKAKDIADKLGMKDAGGALGKAGEVAGYISTVVNAVDTYRKSKNDNTAGALAETGLKAVTDYGIAELPVLGEIDKALPEGFKISEFYSCTADIVGGYTSAIADSDRAIMHLDRAEKRARTCPNKIFSALPQVGEWYTKEFEKRGVAGFFKQTVQDFKEFPGVFLDDQKNLMKQLGGVKQYAELRAKQLFKGVEWLGEFADKMPSVPGMKETQKLVSKLTNKVVKSAGKQLSKFWDKNGAKIKDKAKKVGQGAKKAWEKGKKIFTGAKDKAKKVWNKAKNVWNKGKKMLGGVKDKAKKTVHNLLKTGKDAVKKISKAGGELAKKVAGAINGVTEKTKEVGKKVYETTKEAVKSAKEMGKSAYSAAKSAFKKLKFW